MMPGRHHHSPHGHHGQRPLSAETALSVILACVIAVLLCIAAVSWMLCSQSTDTAACSLLVPALPLHGALRRLRQLRLRWLMWLNTRRMAETERQIAQYRLLLADDRLKLDCLRDQLSAQQTRQLVLASEQ
jgi:hypothetical protein